MANANRFDFTSPVGRLVQGDPFEAQTKDMQGNPLVIMSGPNAGQPKTQFFVGVAYPKLAPDGTTNAEFEAMRTNFDAAARGRWPGLFVSGQCSNPNFSWKIRDGDAVRLDPATGARLENRPELAGHWLVAYGSSFPPKVVVKRNGVLEHIGPSDLKRGYFVRILGHATDNNNDAKPGVYANIEAVELVGLGEELRGGGADLSLAFAAPIALPAGAAALPGLPPAAPVAAPPPVAPVAAPPPVASFIPAPVMTPAAGATPYAAYQAAGWTDSQLIAAGFMIA